MSGPRELHELDPNSALRPLGAALPRSSEAVRVPRGCRGSRAGHARRGAQTPAVTPQRRRARLPASRSAQHPGHAVPRCHVPAHDGAAAGERFGRSRFPGAARACPRADGGDLERSEAVPRRGPGRRCRWSVVSAGRTSVAHSRGDDHVAAAPRASIRSAADPACYRNGCGDLTPGGRGCPRGSKGLCRPRYGCDGRVSVQST